MSLLIAKAKKTSIRTPFLAADATLKLRELVDSQGNALAFASFGTEFVVVVLKQGDSIEIVKCSGISQNATTGTADLTVATNGRNLLPISPYTGSSTGLDWQTAEVIITNDPYTMSRFASLDNANTWDEIQTFTLATRPVLSADGDTTSDAQLVTKGELTRTALGTVTTNRTVIAGTAGETVAAGNLIYLKASDARWWKADADTTAASDDVLLGIAQGAGTAGVAITNGVLIYGRDSNQSGMTPGATYYVSGTAGAISATPGTNNVSIGIAETATLLDFVPRFDGFITPATKALVEAITADAAEINKLDGYTGTTADLNEASAFFQATDITGAEAETLSSGPTSNADARHTHDLYTLQQALDSGTYMEIDVPVNSFASTGALSGGWSDVSGNIVFAPSAMRLTAAGQSTTKNYSGSGPSSNVESIVPNLNWNDRFYVSFKFHTFGDASNDAYIGISSDTTNATPDSADRFMLFFVDNGVLKCISSDGTAIETTTPTNLTYTRANLLTVFHDTSSTKFYVNGTLVATHSTRHPTGTSSTYGFFRHETAGGTPYSQVFGPVRVYVNVSDWNPYS